MVLDIEKEFDKNLTVQDRLRLKLNEFGQRNISITVDELASEMKLTSNSVYQALHRLRQYGEIDLEKTEIANGRDKIVGIVVNKLEPSNRTYKRAADKSSRVEHIKPILEKSIEEIEVVDGIPLLPQTTNYLSKRLAVENMKEQAKEAGLDPSVVAFEPDPQGDEAVILLKLYTEIYNNHEALKKELRQLSFDLEAERRNVEYYKNKVREETRKELMAHARSH